MATYCLQMPSLSEEQLEKLREILTAKGRSYSDPIYNEDGTINMMRRAAWNSSSA